MTDQFSTLAGKKRIPKAELYADKEDLTVKYDILVVVKPLEF